MALRARFSLALVAVAVIAGSGPGCTCSKASAPDAPGASDSARDRSAVEGASPARIDVETGGLSAPIAAARSENGDVVVAGLDVAAASIRVQRINTKDEVVSDKTVLSGVKWSSDSELKMVPAAGGVAITWRGLRAGRLVRQSLVLQPDLSAKGEVLDVSAGACATQDALWFADAKSVSARPWGGGTSRLELPRDEDAALVCGAHRAFALLDEDDGTSLMAFGTNDGGASSSPVVSLLKEADFGNDEQRERAEFTVGDDLGVVRLASSGSLTLREVRDARDGRAAAPSAMRKLRTSIGRDDDVVAVDASPKVIVVVFTEEVANGCAKTGGGGASGASVRVKVLRVDRETNDESVMELDPGSCGHEVGPFFSSAVGDAVSVAWVERVAVAGKARAPIAGLVHRRVLAAAPLGELAHVDLAADALVDAGCDSARCQAVALVRRAGMDAMVPGLARVIRY
jgi:hypothetical protein